MLASTHPVHLVVFDLLAFDDHALLDRPLQERRLLLDAALEPNEQVHRSPATTELAVARRWFTEFEGAGLDGVVAKRLDEPYQPDVRAWVKVKHHRTADCVVAGFRWHKDGESVGSLLLGLHDDDGVLHHVGVCGSFTAKLRRELVGELAPLREGALADHPWKAWADAMAHEASAGRMPGGPSRWNASKDLSWEALRPERVCEVEFSQLTNRRFRHNAHFLRWRPDREPSSCTYGQLEVASPVALAEVLSAHHDGG
jgi:ATP-dependent DNA ligase